MSFPMLCEGEQELRCDGAAKQMEQVHAPKPWAVRGFRIPTLFPTTASENSDFVHWSPCIALMEYMYELFC